MVLFSNNYPATERKLDKAFSHDEALQSLSNAYSQTFPSVKNSIGKELGSNDDSVLRVLSGVADSAFSSTQSIQLELSARSNSFVASPPANLIADNSTNIDSHPLDGNLESLMHPSQQMQNPWSWSASVATGGLSRLFYQDNPPHVEEHGSGTTLGLNFFRPVRLLESGSMGCLSTTPILVGSRWLHDLPFRRFEVQLQAKG